jgi:hypothetical protein
VTHLRKLMLEELECRNYSQSTVRAYVRTVEDFARYFQRPPNQLGPEHIREYQAYLFRERKLAPNTVNQRTGALRFFFVATLKKGWSIAETPYPRKVFRLPKILSLFPVRTKIRTPGGSKPSFENELLVGRTLDSCDPQHRARPFTGCIAHKSCQTPRGYRFIRGGLFIRSLDRARSLARSRSRSCRSVATSSVSFRQLRPFD